MRLPSPNSAKQVLELDQRSFSKRTPGLSRLRIMNHLDMGTHKVMYTTLKLYFTLCVCYIYRIAGIYFEGINFRGNAFRKVFVDLIFVPFFAACNIKFAFNVRGSCLICENHEQLYPRNTKYTRYTVLLTCSGGSRKQERGVPSMERKA